MFITFTRTSMSFDICSYQLQLICSIVSHVIVYNLMCTSLSCVNIIRSTRVIPSLALVQILQREIKFVFSIYCSISNVLNITTCIDAYCTTLLKRGARLYTAFTWSTFLINFFDRLYNLHSNQGSNIGTFWTGTSK